MPRLSKSRRATTRTILGQSIKRTQRYSTSNIPDDSNIIYINDEEEDAMYQWSCKHSAVVTDTADDVGVDTVDIVDTLPSSANIDSEQQSTDTVDIQPREAMREEATLDVPDGAKFLFGADYLSNAPKRSAVVLLWARAVSDAKRFCTNKRDCGTSRWSKNRLEKKRSQLRAAGAANGNRITTFFPVLPVPIEPAVNGIIEHEANEAFEGAIDLEEVAAYEEENVLEKIFALANNEAKIVRNKRHCKSSNSLGTWHTLVSLAILRYLEIYMECGRRMNASIQVANVIFGKSSSKDSYRAACIRLWAKSFVITGLLPDFRQGKHAKIVSVISREDVRQTFRQLLRNMSDKDRSPETFQKLLNTDILLTIPGAPPSISLDAARRWMHIVGFRPCKLRKHYYTDGHNREDVLAYRTTFLAQMETYEKRFTMYEGENMETVVPPTEENLAGDKEVIFITHDETTFYANDCNTSMWMEGAKQKIRPKSVGTSLMVSGFVCPCHGFMRG